MLLATLAGITAAALSSTKGDARAAQPNSCDDKEWGVEKDSAPKNIEDCELRNGSQRIVPATRLSSKGTTTSRKKSSRKLSHHPIEARLSGGGHSPICRWRVIPNPPFQAENEESEQEHISEERRIRFADFLFSVSGSSSKSVLE